MQSDIIADFVTGLIEKAGLDKVPQNFYDEYVEKIKAEVNIEEVIVEEKKEEIIIPAAKVCLDCGNPLPPEYDPNEDLCADCKTKKLQKAEEIIPEIKVEETKVEAEVKLEEVAKTTPEETVAATEVKPEIVEEVKKEEAQIVVQTQEIVKIDEITPGLETVSTEIKTETKSIDDSGKETMKIVEETKIVETYTREQLDEAVAAAKAEKDIEIEKLKGELEKKSQEIVKAKVEETTPLSLTVGEVTTTDNDKYREIQKSVNRKAYGHD